jgi:preprotein translocase SecF subunit
VAQMLNNIKSKIKAMFNGGFEFNKVLKRYLAVSLIIALIAVGLSFVFLNVGFDFSGGSIVKVESSFFEEEALNDYNKTVKQAFSSAKVKIVSLQYDEEDAGAFMIKYQKGKSDKLSEIEDALLKYFKDNHGLEVDISTENVDGWINYKLFMAAGLSLLVLAAAAFIYFWIRFDLHGALAAFLAMLFDVALTLALTIIFHIKLGAAIFVSLSLIALFSLYNSIFIFSRIKESAASHAEKTDIRELVNESSAVNLPKAVIASGLISAAALLVSLIASAYVRQALLPLAIGVLVCAASSVFVTAPLWLVLKNIIKIKTKEGMGLFVKRKKPVHEPSAEASEHGGGETDKKQAAHKRPTVKSKSGKRKKQKEKKDKIVV